ncbi:MAG: LCP family protein [Solirubrobacterales bacterium]
MRQYYALVFADEDDRQGERPDYPVYRGGRGRPRKDGDIEQPPPGGEDQPEYTVYRSRKGLRGMLTPSLAAFRQRLRRGGGTPQPAGAGGAAAAFTWKRVLKWLLIAAVAWFLLSVVLFAISAQVQKSRLADSAAQELGGFPLLLLSGQTILVIGTDARPVGTNDGSNTRRKCLEQAQTGEAPSSDCPGFRADTLMLVRAGGGTFRKLSIPRDTFAEIPGQTSQKINAAYALGGAELQIQTVENFLGTGIDHVVILDFEGFADFIDVLGGVTVDLDSRVKSKISGGTGNGGITLNLKKGENDLDGQEALALARTRQNLRDASENDLDRAARQQQILSGIKSRLTSIARIPVNFIKGPWIAWSAPKTMVSDMGAFVMPQLPIAAAIGGDEPPAVLEPSAPGPGGSLAVPLSECERAVEEFLGGEGDETPACSPI